MSDMKDRILGLWQNKGVRIAIVVVLSAMVLISVVQGSRNAVKFSQDFQWDAAKAFSMKIDPYDESLSPSGALNSGSLKDFYDRFESINAPQKMEANQFPSLLMLLLPYTFMTPDAARIAWLISNLIFTAGIIVLLRATFLKSVPDYEFSVLMLLMLSGTPFRNQIGVGQHTLFSLCFFLLAVWFLDKKWGNIPSALALTVSYFKYTLTAPLALYFIYKRKWKEFATSVLIHVALTEVAALWLNESFMDMLIKPLKVSSALASEGGLDFGALFNGSSIAFVLAGLVMIALFVLALKLPDEQDGLLIGILVLWSLIITYHRTYDFFAMVVAAALVGAKGWNERSLTDKIRLAGFVFITLLVFYELRVFDEALPARIATGILYYAYTIFITISAFMLIKNKKENNEL